MRILDIIDVKKHGGELTEGQINRIVSGFVSGEVPDYQMSAFLMAVCLKGMSSRETAHLTKVMLESGDTVDLSCFGALSADKHSTGGVGDKTTLIVAPVVSSLGGVVAKMSGRGLGHTGGTIDKLESIEGFRTELSPHSFLAQAKNIGVSVTGQTGNLVPADKKIYALRDATSTVDSIPLIASSIMSKKLAAGAKNIVLDVKMGSGAFMKTLKDAQALAGEMVSIGKSFGRNMAALITNMDVPLGQAVGNSLEVIEAVQTLKGGGCKDLREVSMAISAQMLSLCFGWDEKTALERVNDEVDSGRAFTQMKKWVSAQGGNAAWLDNTELFPKAPFTYEIKARTDGYVTQIDTEKVGAASCVLGAGRAKKDDTIDMSAGIVLSHKIGCSIEKGCVLAVLHTSDESRILEAQKILNEAITLGKTAPKTRKLLIKTIL